MVWENAKGRRMKSLASRALTRKSVSIISFQKINTFDSLRRYRMLLRRLQLLRFDTELLYIVVPRAVSQSRSSNVPYKAGHVDLRSANDQTSEPQLSGHHQCSREKYRQSQARKSSF